jgi:hypothetical protein
MKNIKSILGCGLGLLIVGCSNSPNVGQTPPSSLPPIAGGANGVSYVKAKAEFDLSSAPDGSAQFNLVKKSYAASPNCLHGQCTDFTDITVTNSGSTQFQLVQSQAQISQNTSNQNLSNIVDLKIATLFDNNLTSCGGQKCTAAAIRIYTNDSTGVQGAGLWSQAIGKSVPLTVSGGSSNSILAMVPYFSAAGTPDNGTDLQIDLNPLAVDKNVLSLQMADFSDAAAPAGAGYTLSADFTQAGAGSYKAHVVVEYDLIGPPAIPTSSTVYVGGRDTSGAGAYWYSGSETTPDNANFIQSLAVSSSGDVYAAGLQNSGIPAIWKNGAIQSQAPTNRYAYSVVYTSGADLYVGGRDGSFHPFLMKNGIALSSQPNAITSSTNFAGILVSGSDLYTFGFDDNNSGAYWNWTTGVETEINCSDGQPAQGLSQLIVSSSDIYVAGRDDNYNPSWWKNGVEMYSDQSGNSITSMFLSGTDFYEAGYIDGGPLAYWVNGQENDIDPNLNSSGSTGSINVSGGHVYVGGQDGNGAAALWVDGVETVLDPNGGGAFSNIVVTN